MNLQLNSTMLNSATLNSATLNSTKLKAMSAGVGLVAAGAMAAIGVVSSGAAAEAQNWIQGPMNTGVTVTKSTAGNEPEVKKAEPPFTFTTPEGFAVPH